MAEYGLLWKPGTIKGNVTLKGYEDSVGCLSFTYGSSAMRSNQGGANGEGVSVSMGGAALIIHAGAWTAELLEALYRTHDLGDTTIWQLSQAVDPAAEAKPTVLQKFVLSNTLITGLAMDFEGGGSIRTASIQLEFSHFVQTYDTKTSDFIIRNVVAKAI